MKLTIDGTEYEATKIEPPKAQEWFTTVVFYGYEDGVTYVCKDNTGRLGRPLAVAAKFKFDNHGVYFDDQEAKGLATAVRGIALKTEDRYSMDVLKVAATRLAGPPPK